MTSAAMGDGRFPTGVYTRVDGLDTAGTLMAESVQKKSPKGPE